MILLEDLHKEDIRRIAERCAGAFLAEEGMLTMSLNHDQAVTYFMTVLKMMYRHHCLYAYSANEEAYCIYYKKTDAPSAWQELKVFFEYLFHLPLSALSKLVVSHHDWQDYEMQFMNEPEYLDVFLVVVCREYQGKGYFRRIMEELYEIAEREKTDVILDTDSELKALKYQHAGMQVVKDKVLESGLHMYTLRKEYGHDSQGNME